ncbi:hypothetical protein DPMN_139295 [Dreissena polymorpha]|uniref:Uncharacterized protein n=1 Tax=Dreissena polymorpha TaxID=45954 RepID=A0A9D4G8S7_DREPO|nr:hypothetical protein DPMN_139295 [Dreissena polymorpha]
MLSYDSEAAISHKIAALLLVLFSFFFSVQSSFYLHLLCPFVNQVFRRKKLVIRLANAGGLAGWLAGWRAGGLAGWLAGWREGGTSLTAL